MTKLRASLAGSLAFWALLGIAAALAAGSAAQSQLPGAPAASKEASTATQEKDPLGRSTPRGTVLGFLSAAHKGNFQLATGYLQTNLQGREAEVLAQQFVMVLDNKLPAKLNLLSDSPEGALVDPLHPKRDVVGIMSTDGGDIPVTVERVNDRKAGEIWLFSAATLSTIPAIYAEVSANQIGTRLPRFLVNRRILGIPLFEWMILLLGFPLFYALAVVINRVYGLIMRLFRRWTRRERSPPRREFIPAPLRVLLIGFAMLSVRAELALSLLARQVWTNIASVVCLIAIIWLLIRMVALAERLLLHHLRRSGMQGTSSILRLGRRLVDVLIVFAGILCILFFFGVNPSPALAGLGVGGIAVALAAQKTLENVIGGASIILDQAVKVGDSLKFGTVQGTVEEIGLRSTSIRTPDRTLVSVPNGQLATLNIEAFSARDKFWFHPMLNLAQGTSAAQLETILSRSQAFLEEHPAVERNSCRVRFVALGAYSLDVEVFAYIYAATGEAFLLIQQQLLLGLMHIVEEAGSRMALPSQVVIQGGELPANTPPPQPVPTLNAPEPPRAAVEILR